ncbi:non-homologous end joining protein Ku [Saccharomonospora cyanea]|uniref:Non-homologous end joining protein Ku n=1 Tax=Saccharomonospora cyanea NA-134 TaxID=882082 RepID=H5XD85_9PSEU|nr:Ku protein [Saccharomonospora cyanea]EHR59165.1 Ku protein [Saccharomonospora cyanea NA-134]
MARAIWSGALNFGLVTVPVELYSATQDHTIHFRQFQRGTPDRIRYRRVNERTGEEVPYDEIVKGYDLGGEEYVILEPQELDEIAPGRSRTIDIDAFVGLEEIDPIYFQKTYWLAPTKEEFGRSYSLLLEALTKTNRVGLARLVMRGKEYIAAVRAGDGVLMLNTLLFPEDIKEPHEVTELPETGQAGEREIDMAVSLIESMAEKWEPEDYHDTYTERVMQLIEDKRAGRTITPAEEPRAATKIVDLFEALSRSIEGRRQEAGKPSKRAGSRTKETEEKPRRGRAAGRDKQVRRTTASRGKRSEVALSELTKGDLDRMARDLDIKGRSKMNRAELEKAVRNANRRQERRRRAS